MRGHGTNCWLAATAILPPRLGLLFAPNFDQPWASTTVWSVSLLMMSLILVDAVARLL